MKGTLVERGGRFPEADVGFKLEPTAEGSDENIDTCEFGDLVASGLEELVVAYLLLQKSRELLNWEKGAAIAVSVAAISWCVTVPNITLSSLIKSRGDK